MRVSAKVFGVVMMAFVVSAAGAQILHADGPQPSFEVATIKPWHRAPSPLVGAGVGTVQLPAKVDPGSGGVREVSSDRVHMIIPVLELIGSAYGLPPDSGRRIVGGPEWLRQDIDQYEIAAKIDAAEFAAMKTMTPAQQRERVKLMEQSLLAERFKLKVHFETRDLPAYALVVAKSGQKLSLAKEGEANKLTSGVSEHGQVLTATAVTMSQLAKSPLMHGGTAGRPVVDQTGLAGAYDFTMLYAPEGVEGDSPSFFTALREQLGLRLVPLKTQVEVIVVEGIEKPTEN